MEIRKIENPEGTLARIEFVNTGDDSFKNSIKAWLHDNYPTMSFQEFFERLQEFHSNMCSINML